MFYFFDLDGTLSDSNGVWKEIDREFTRRRGVPLTKEYEDFVASTMAPAAAVFTKEYYSLPESPEAIMNEWSAMAADAYAHTIPLRSGADRFLARCLAEGNRAALVTAAMPELCEAFLSRYNLRDSFEFILYAQEHDMEKRTPSLWHFAAEMAGMSPEECIVIDDSPDVLRAAKEAGCVTLGIADMLYAHRQEELRSFSDRYITRWEELL